MDDAIGSGLDDTAFRRGMVIFRWLITAMYIGLAVTGVLDVSTGGAIVCAVALVLFHAFFTWQRWILANASDRLFFFTRHCDVILVTLAMISVADVRNPIWAVYFIAIVGVAHFVTSKEMLAYVLWCDVNYLVATGTTAALGHEVSWAYVTVVALLMLFMGFNASIIAGGETRRRELIATMAVTDSLTGLPNRRLFHQSYVSSLTEAIAAETPLALMLIDFDHFKTINDRDGHPAGDDKLREVAQALSGATRGGDLVARYGGDEFVVVAPHTGRPDALALGERLRAAAIGCGASVSVGVAMYPDDASQQDGLLAAADAALYLAKQAGRNCVRTAAAAAAA